MAELGNGARPVRDPSGVAEPIYRTLLRLPFPWLTFTMALVLGLADSVYVLLGW